MSDPNEAMQTQLVNLEKRSGKSLAALHEILTKSGLEKHGEMVTMLKTKLHMGHGDANLVVHLFRSPGGAAGASAAAPAGAAADGGDALAAIYAGSKAPLRALHDAVMAKVAKFGPFEIAPKKANVSLRRKKQWALLGPGSKGRLEIGLNMKGVPATDRLQAQPPGGMCQYKVWLTAPNEVDQELLGWLRTAYDAAQ
jgi:hypothetical protein